MIRTTFAVLILVLTFGSVVRASDDRSAAATEILAADAAAPAFITSPVLSTPSNSTSRGLVLPTLYVGLAGLHALDAYTTTEGLSRGGREANPVLRPIAGNAAALWAVKGAATIASIAVGERLWRQNRRRQAIVMMLVTNAVLSTAVTRNVRGLRQP